MHTPGPWYPSNLGLGSTGHGPYTWPLGTDPDIAAANARLIAQAPVLKEFVAMVRVWATHAATGGTVDWPVIAEDARAILRTVEG
jgi:hypothetical protein